MRSPLFAGNSNADWAIMGAIVGVAVISGAFFIRSLRNRNRHSSDPGRGFPLSLMAIIASPAVGAVLGVLNSLGARNEDYPYGQWDYFKGYVICSTVLGVIVAIVLAIVVEVPKRTVRAESKNDD